jgi:hypothetical protein
VPPTKERVMGNIGCEKYKAEPKDLASFALLYEKCYFCEQPRTLHTNEHYIFCPNCMSLYTYMMVHKNGCTHIKNNTPVLLSDMHKPGRDMPAYIYEDSDDLYGKGGHAVVYRCSKCNRECKVDGW